MMDLYRLSLPFPRSAVHWRVQGQPYERDGKYSAMALAYLDARDVMDRLDDVCGPENWQQEYTETVKGRIICRLGIRVGGDWVWKSDGAGDTDVEGEKGALSDALKRSAVPWGIGRYLYRISSPWVPCDVTKKGEKTYWKKWSDDPWKQVKDAPPEASPSEIFEAIRALVQAQDMAALHSFWKGLYANSRHVADHLAVLTAKDAAKNQLNQKDAA